MDAMCVSELGKRLDAQTGEYLVDLKHCSRARVALCGAWRVCRQSGRADEKIRRFDPDQSVLWFTGARLARRHHCFPLCELC